MGEYDLLDLEDHDYFSLLATFSYVCCFIGVDGFAYDINSAIGLVEISCYDVELWGNFYFYSSAY